MTVASDIHYSFYQEYQLINIFDDPDSPLRGRVTDLWIETGVLPRADAVTRANQIVLVALDDGKRVAGVSTVYIDDFRGPGDSYYFYRLFIAPGHRVYGMMKFMTAMTRDFLRDRVCRHRPNGVVIITENPKLMRTGIKREFRRIDFKYAGKNSKGLDIWVSEF